MCPSLLLQQFPACLVRQIRMIFEMGVFLFVCLFFPRVHTLGSHGKQYVGWEARRLNPARVQRRATSDCGRTNPTGQRLGSNS